mgnify:FL=1
MTMKISPEVAARLTQMAERIALGYKLPDTVRGVIEQALYRAAGSAQTCNCNEGQYLEAWARVWEAEAAEWRAARAGAEND